MSDSKQHDQSSESGHHRGQNNNNKKHRNKNKQQRSHSGGSSNSKTAKNSANKAASTNQSSLAQTDNMKYDTNPWRKHKKNAGASNTDGSNVSPNATLTSNVSTGGGAGSNNGSGGGGGRGGGRGGYWQKRRGGNRGGHHNSNNKQQQQHSPNNNRSSDCDDSTTELNLSTNADLSHSGAPKRGRSTSGDDVMSARGSSGSSSGGNRQQRKPRRENNNKHSNQHKKGGQQSSNNISTVVISGAKPNPPSHMSNNSDRPSDSETEDNVHNATTTSNTSTSDSDDNYVQKKVTANTASTGTPQQSTLLLRNRSSTGTNTTPHTRPKHQSLKTPLVMPTPDGVSPLQDPTVFVSPYVRVVMEGEDNSTTVRTLESLLKYGTAGVGTEEDTPFLAPSAGPDFDGSIDNNGGGFSADTVATMLRLNGAADIVDLSLGSDEDELQFVGNHSIGGVPSVLSSFAQNAKVRPPSPGLKFSLDGVATPNTWGAIASTVALATSGAMMPASICLPPATDGSAAGRFSDFSSGLSINKSISTAERSMYRFLLNDYDRETDTFRYRTASMEMKANLMQRISDLCTKVSGVLEQECLMSVVATPVYCLGDIHGNFCDLSYFLKAVLAFNDIHLSPCNILCLGDYVDRGPFSLECVLLLFALKATAPGKVTLLRGNHEDRVVCGDRRTYGNDCFLAQCQNIFGMQDGFNVFIKVTEVFRHLPLAAEIVVSNAPNNPQAPRDLADEDDWESVPNNSMAKSKDSAGGTAMGTATGSGSNTNSPLTSLNNVGVAERNSNNVTPSPERSPQPTHANPPKTPKNGFRIEHTSQRDVRKMFTDRNWLRRQTHVERILCTHGGIPRFSGPPRDSDSLAFLRSPNFPRLLTLFPNNPLMRDYQPAEVDRFRNVPEEVMQRAWFTMFDLMWSDPTVDDSNVNEWGFGINTRGTTVVSFSTKAVETFLDAYKYTMLFRAHQEKAHGIRLSKSKKVLTIFSTSNYLGHGNGAGCAVVSPFGEIQLIVKASE